MKTIKTIISPIAYVAICIYIFFYLEDGNPLKPVFLIVLLSFIVFNLFVRKSLSFKNYFTSNFNPFTTSIKTEKKFNISRELMFEKVVEVIKHSNFTLEETNKEKYEIMATTPMTLKSWGENIYINFDSVGNEAVMKVCSATFMQMVSWGKNQSNFDNLIAEIEESFII